MSKAVYSINLDLHKTQPQLAIAARQGDSGREIHIALHEDGQPYKIERGCFAVLSVITPSGNAIEENCIIKDSKLIYAFSVGITATKGIMDVEIGIFDKNAKLISTPKFTLVVDPRAAVGDAIVKSDSFKMLDQLYNETNALKISLENLLSGDDAITLSKILKELEQTKSDFNSHISQNIVSENGVHNFRIKNKLLEFFDGNTWRNVELERNYKIMSVLIKRNNYVPEQMLSYSDDAKDITPGSVEWDNFFGHYPVLLKDGKEVGKLDPTDFSKFEDGTPISVDNGETNDVCIAFPRRGIKIEKFDAYTKVSMTDHPDLFGFEYNAHRLNNTHKNIFYVGAYLASLTENADGKTVMSSLSNKPVSIINTLSTAQEYAHNKNALLFSYYQWLFIQCMYVLKYKNLDSQRAVCCGFIGSGNSVENLTTGISDTYGMDSSLLTKEERTSGNYRSKLLGLEDIYGTLYQWLDCISTSQSYIYANWGGNHISAIGDLDGLIGTGYASDIIGTTRTGFLPAAYAGSNSTFFTDWTVLYSSSYCIVGGDNTGGYGAGIFCFRLGEQPDEENKSYDKSARIMYL